MKISSRFSSRREIYASFFVCFYLVEAIFTTAARRRRVEAAVERVRLGSGCVRSGFAFVRVEFGVVRVGFGLSST